MLTTYTNLFLVMSRHNFHVGTISNDFTKANSLGKIDAGRNNTKNNRTKKKKKEQ